MAIFSHPVLLASLGTRCWSNAEDAVLLGTDRAAIHELNTRVGKAVSFQRVKFLNAL